MEVACNLKFHELARGFCCQFLIESIDFFCEEHTCRIRPFLRSEYRLNFTFAGVSAENEKLDCRMQLALSCITFNQPQ
jgi:hypothetical protein